uniref:Uncharacterized protein n=1 Tax=Triticum urartu TaxID=4572 RepID=A0A8R7V6W3_TRIUA
LHWQWHLLEPSTWLPGRTPPRCRFPPKRLASLRWWSLPYFITMKQIIVVPLSSTGKKGGPRPDGQGWVVCKSGSSEW